MSPQYSPEWLNALDATRKNEVVQWLIDNKVNPDLCAGFDFDGVDVIAHMYEVGQENLPIWDAATNNPRMAMPKIFRPRTFPRALSYR